MTSLNLSSLVFIFILFSSTLSLINNQKKNPQNQTQLLISGMPVFQPPSHLSALSKGLGQVEKAVGKG